jgi:hypothetical protein
MAERPDHAERIARCVRRRHGRAPGAYPGQPPASPCSPASEARQERSSAARRSEAAPPQPSVERGDSRAHSDWRAARSQVMHEGPDALASLRCPPPRFPWANSRPGNPARPDFDGALDLAVAPQGRVYGEGAQPTRNKQ